MNDSTTTENTVIRDAVLFLILLLLAGLASYCLWAVTTVMSRYVPYALHRPQPYITQFFFDNRLFLLFFPSPWFFFALYSVFRGPRTAHALIFFVSTLILALVTLATILATALTMPWVSIIQHA